MSKKAPVAAKSEKTSTSKSGHTSVTESDTTEKTVSEMGGDGQSVTAATQYDISVAQAASAYAQSSKSLQDYSVAGPISKDQQDKAVIQIKKMTTMSKSTSSKKATGRKVFIMRHGERMDRLFPEWLHVAITDEGKYIPYDLNQPLTMIERAGGWAEYENDSPITEMGNLGGQMVGRGLKSSKADIKQIICSPALRCVQTAHAILKTLESDVKISIEPGLFEWLAWYDKMPQWFELQTLAQTGKFKINESYKPIISIAEMAAKKNETTKEYYERITIVTKKLIDQKGFNTTLIVGHGSTIEIVGRSLVGKPMVEINRVEMEQMGIKYPYCAVVAIEELAGGHWKVVPSALPQMNFLGFSNRFDPDYFNRP